MSSSQKGERLRGYRIWTRTAKAYLKGTLRRGKTALFPDRSVREYRRQLAAEKRMRRERYPSLPDPGLFSVLTPVWNGSPPRYLRALAHALAGQNASGACQWVLLDNGCRNETLLRLLSDLSAWPWVKAIRSERNLGITGGLRRCLEEASGRYVLPVDADDLLDDDVFRVLASAAAGSGYPPLLYTDEDKLIGARRYDPYRKPSWDPVLLLNSAYTAHLGVIDRETALKVGAYSNGSVEGSPDWDLFVRLLLAGYRALHIPEIVYSWRAHSLSTADDSANKPYIVSSQRAVLQYFLDNAPNGHLFSLEESALWPGGAHWHFIRKKQNRRPGMAIPTQSADIDAVRQAARVMAEQEGIVFFADERLRVTADEWHWEAQGLMELHPETALVGGRIWNTAGRIVEAGLSFETDGQLSNPQRGRMVSDPGYFGQMWKQRSVAAVSTRLAAIDAQFLLEAMQQIPGHVSGEGLGFWLSAYARRAKRRVVYSPFLAGVADGDSEELLSGSEREALRHYVTDLPQ